MADSTAVQSSLTIMILEDNRADVYLLKEALHNAEIEFEALVFEDGERAFHYLEELASETKPVPDLAILDLNVPKYDGSEVLAQIRQNARARHIPVVIFSSSPKAVMLERTAQADCYITKPANLDRFLEVGYEMRRCLESAKTRNVTEASDAVAFRSKS